MIFISKKDILKIYPMNSDNCEKCAQPLEIIEFPMDKTSLDAFGFFNITAKACPTCKEDKPL